MLSTTWVIPFVALLVCSVAVRFNLGIDILNSATSRLSPRGWVDMGPHDRISRPARAWSAAAAFAAQHRHLVVEAWRLVSR
jgi:hypothetical protein